MDRTKEIIEEKDEKIAQLERQVREFNIARQQMAATIAVDHSSRSFTAPKGIGKSFIKASRLNIILVTIILVLVVITSGVIWLSVGNASKTKSVTFVEKVQAIATLATAEAYMKTVIQDDGNKIFSKDIPIELPGTKREIVLVVPGTVIAGVDLKGITSEDMVIHEETNEIKITLPHAEVIQDPSLQMDKVLAVADGGLFSGGIKWEEGRDLTAKAQKQMRQEAESSGLLVTAEKNAEIALKEIFKNTDYTVNVTFK